MLEQIYNRGGADEETTYGLVAAALRQAQRSIAGHLHGRRKNRREQPCGDTRNCAYAAQGQERHRRKRLATVAPHLTTSLSNGSNRTSASTQAVEPMASRAPFWAHFASARVTISSVSCIRNAEAQGQYLGPVGATECVVLQRERITECAEAVLHSKLQIAQGR